MFQMARAVTPRASANDWRAQKLRPARWLAQVLEFAQSRPFVDGWHSTGSLFNPLIDVAFAAPDWLAQVNRPVVDRGAPLGRTC